MHKLKFGDKKSKAGKTAMVKSYPMIKSKSSETAFLLSCRGFARNKSKSCLTKSMRESTSSSESFKKLLNPMRKTISLTVLEKMSKLNNK